MYRRWKRNRKIRSGAPGNQRLRKNTTGGAHGSGRDAGSAQPCSLGAQSPAIKLY
jgi:hypothetical protein